MSRPPSHYRDEIMRAVSGARPAMGALAFDTAKLDSLAVALAQAESAKQMLCAKRYGEPSMPIDAMVLLVPDAVKR